MDDYISRQMAINTANALYAKCETGDITDLRDMIVAGLDCLPSAQPKQGRWDGYCKWGELGRCSNG